jgi:hypothetical protein
LNNVHHARSSTSSEENLHGGCHNFGLRFAHVKSIEQCVKALLNDVHRIADFGQLLFALDRARHVEVEIEGNEFKAALLQLAIVAHRHDVVESIDRDALPGFILGSFAQPAARDIGPNFLLHEGLLLVADPARLLREHQHRIASQRDENAHITMYDLETRGVEYGAFEARVLVAADDERVDALFAHRGADIGVSAIDFYLGGHLTRGLDPRIFLSDSPPV